MLHSMSITCDASDYYDIDRPQVIFVTDALAGMM